jgi:hypothetical protein
MKLECSWCHKDLGSREPAANDATTHGICPACLQTRIYPFLRQIRSAAPRQLARLPRPGEIEL